MSELGQVQRELAVIRRRAMKVARLIERQYPDIHRSMMVIADMVDTAAERITLTEWVDEMEQMAWDADAVNERRAKLRAVKADEEYEAGERAIKER